MYEWSLWKEIILERCSPTAKGPCSSRPEQWYTIRKIVFVLLPTCQEAGCWGIFRENTHDAIPDSYKMLNLHNHGKLWDVYWSANCYGTKCLPLYHPISTWKKKEVLCYFAYYSIFMKNFKLQIDVKLFFFFQFSWFSPLEILNYGLIPCFLQLSALGSSAMTIYGIVFFRVPSK